MKNLRVTLGIAALAIGSFAAFSFAPSEEKIIPTTQEFYVNPDGSRGNQIIGENICPDDEQDALCSQEYELNPVTSNWEATGDPSKMHYRALP